MAVNKNFVVKNGLEVNTNLILADVDSSRVGIGTSIADYTLHVNGGIGATDLYVSGIATFASIDVTNDVAFVDLDSTNINVTGVGTIVNGAITNITGTAATIGSVQIASGIVTAASGIVTYYGDGGNLTGIVAGVGIRTEGSIAGYGITFLDFRGAGISTITAPVSGISTINITGGGGGGSISISTTAPPAPGPGDLWYSPDRARTFIYYDESEVGYGTSKQWIDASPFNVGVLSATSLSVGSLSLSNDLNVSGVVTASSFTGDGSQLTNLPESAGLGTALSEDKTSPLNKIYYTDKVLSVGSTITINPPDSSQIAYTQYSQIALNDGADLIVSAGDDFIPDILGLSTEGVTPLVGAGGRIRADLFTNKAGTGAPTFQTGLNVTGVVTATSGSFSGDVSIADKIVHTGDTNTAIRFPAADTFTVETAGSERVRVTSGGLVGIGSDNPGNANLAVVSATQAAFSIGQNTDGSGANHLGIYYGTGLGSPSGADIFTSNGNMSFWVDGAGGSGSSIEFGKGFGAAAGGANWMTINSSGSVGIGTDSPQAKLHVAGTTRIGDNNANDAELQIGAGASGNRNAIIDLVGDTTYTDYGFRVIRDNGGANTASRLLHRGTGDFRVIAQEAAPMQFWTSNTERMRINSSGVITIKNGAVAEIDTLSSAATVTPDFAASCNFTLTLGQNLTIANPSNLTAGQSGSIFLIQDGTGSRTSAFGSSWDFVGGTAPTLSTAAGSVDRLDYFVRSSTSIHTVVTLAYS